MPENKILDPFKPAQPRIPGVSAPEEKRRRSAGIPEEAMTCSWIYWPADPLPRTTTRLTLKFVWVGLTLAGALATAFLLFGLKRNSRCHPKPWPSPRSQSSLLP